MNIDRAELICLTEEYGGPWGINHTRRLLKLITMLGEGQPYNAVVGVLRDFFKNAKDLRQAYEISRKRRKKLPAMLCLARAQAIAVQRLQDLDNLFAKFEADSFGCFWGRLA